MTAVKAAARSSVVIARNPRCRRQQYQPARHGAAAPCQGLVGPASRRVGHAYSAGDVPSTFFNAASCTSNAARKVW
jgi:hypothetical protein